MSGSNQRRMLAALSGLLLMGAGAGPALSQEIARAPDASAAERLALG